MRKGLLFFLLLAAMSWTGTFVTDASAATPVLSPQSVDNCPQCKAVLPEAQYFQQQDQPVRFFKAFCPNANNMSGHPCGFAYFTKDITPEIQGFAGPIELLIGCNSQGVIQKVICLKHAETSGYVEPLTRLLDQFRQHRSSDSLELNKDVDGITGATITSAAITQIVRDSLRIVSSAALGSTSQTPQAASSPSDDEINAKLRAAGLSPQDARYWKILEEKNP